MDIEREMSRSSILFHTLTQNNNILSLKQMKLRSHEILSTPQTPIRSSANPSRLKQLFQRKNLFKKKQSTAHPTGLIHQIPDYVRKSIFRFLLEVKPASPPPPPPPPPSSARAARPPPVMGIQALKNKKQHFQRPAKRSLRIKQQTAHEHRPSFEDYQPPQPTNYDMTILHMNIEDIDDKDDEDEFDSIFATKTSTNQNKPIPQWARKNELQIAICNQLYFHRNASEIFGNSMDCSPAHLRTILHSMLPNVDLFDDNLHQSTINSNKSILI